MLLGGASPHESKPGEHRLIGVLEGCIDNLLAPYEQAMEVTPELRASLMELDLEALVAILRAGWPSLMDSLHAMQMPCLIYAREADEQNYPSVEACASMLPNLTHPTSFTESKVILPHIRKFLSIAS